MSIYPNGAFSWVPRQDDLDDVFANDPNELANEVIAIEQTLGLNPQNGALDVRQNPVNFSTVSERIFALETGQNLPLATLASSGVVINNAQPGPLYGVFNTYSAAFDPYSLYNSVDVTAPVTRWYEITAGQWWPYVNNGYVRMSLVLNASIIRQDTFFWRDAPANRDANTSVSWMGQISAGTRIRVLSENGTTVTPLTAYGLDLSVKITR